MTEQSHQPVAVTRRNTLLSSKVTRLFGAKSSHDLSDNSEAHPNKSASLSKLNTAAYNETPRASVPPLSVPASATTAASHSSSSSASDSSAATLLTKRSNSPPESNNNTTPKLATPSTSKIRTPVSSNSMHAPPTPGYRRFIVHEDGTHEHSLKSTKGQEKLTTMIRNMMTGSQKIRDQAKSAVPDIMVKDKNAVLASPMSSRENAPPSLFSGLMKQVVNMKDAEDMETGFVNSSGVSDSQKILRRMKQKQPRNEMVQPIVKLKTNEQEQQCFVQKYGRCQEVIGKGAFGVVRICHKKQPKAVETLYAVKEFKRKSSEPFEKYSKRLISEFCISSSLKHTNIVMTLDLFQDAKGDYCEVMEYCAGGDLFTLIVAAGKLEYLEADCFFKQLIKGVVYMHNMGVAHRDLKPENLLLTSDGTLKITDFGNSECFKMAWEEDIHLSGGVCGSSPYIPPEEYTQNEFDPRPVDIWACGVIYMAMRTGRQLWRIAQKEDEFYSKYIKGRKEKDGYEPIEKLKRARCRNVIYSMLDPVPHRRINGKQILNSEWGREIDCCLRSHAVK